jgi:acyl-CoA synthetase (AMP-forming)/AMP-acid ligase II
MRLATVESSLSPEPLLAALDGYRGSIIDLSRGRVHGPASLARDHRALVAALRSRGLEAGDRVVLAIANGPGFVCLLTAILAAGGSPLLSHVKTPPLELRRTALRFGAAWIVADEWSTSEMMAAGLAAEPLCGESFLGCLCHRVDQRDPDFHPDLPPLVSVPLHPTSGTTGAAKVALRPGAAAVAEAAHYIETIDIGPADVILAATPMSHAYAYGMAFMTPLLSGCNLVTSRNLDAAGIRKALIENGVTILPAVPAMLDLLTFGAGDRLRNTARCVLSAGAPLPERTARRFFECSGIQVRPLFGTTETGGISVGPNSGHVPATGYVGPPMRGVEVEVRPATDDVSDADAPGRLYIRSSSMMAGYLDSAGIDTSPLVDGWFLTGDLATRDPEGGIHLKGRQSEVINVGGLKVIPCEVEEVIGSLPEVSEVKVYAGQDRKGRQFVKAAVVVNNGVDAQTIQKHCEARLVYYKRPRTVIIVEALPRTPSGKIIVSELP